MPYNISGVKLSHSQGFSLVMDGNVPDQCEVHNNRVFFGAGDFVQISPVNRVGGFVSTSREFFRGVGEGIVSMRSYNDMLIVFTSRNTYAITGNSDSDWGVEKIHDEQGGSPHYAAIPARGVLWFQGIDGGVYGSRGYNGEARCVSSHLDDFGDGIADDGAKLPDADIISSAVYSRGSEGEDIHLLCQPRNPASDKPFILRSDPDSIRDNPSTGESVLSWYKMTTDWRLKHIWSNEAGLFGVGENPDGVDGMMCQLDVDGVAEQNHPMVVAFAVTFDLTGNNLVTRISLTSRDTDGTISIVGEDGTPLTMSIGNEFRIGRPGRAIRKINEPIRPQDPVAPIITYQSQDAGAALLAVGYSGFGREF